MSGIDFLKTSSTLPLTILTTAYSEYAVEGFELDVLDYLVKPFSFDRFLKAVTKAKEYCELQNKPVASTQIDQTNNYFFVKCNGKIEKVFYDDLIYVEAMMNYVVLHTADKKMIVYLTIKSIAEQLPETMFLKIHKSTIINTSKIKSIEGNEIDMRKAKVIISQNLHDNVMREILKDKMLKR
jgi:two-component system, LytTR family, response regulator